MGECLSAEALRCGIIDVGSNTIRAAVYAVQSGSYELLADHRDFSNLLTFVEDGQLSDEGAERLCRVLREMKSFCGEWSCTRIDCFATAAAELSGGKKKKPAGCPCNRRRNQL